MSEVDHLILDIYRLSREAPVEAFQGKVLATLRTVMPFDSCRWATGDVRAAKVRTVWAHLENESEGIVADWEEVSHQDSFKAALLENPGRASRLHAPTAFSGRNFTAYREYLTKYRHENVLGIAIPAQLQGCVESLSLFRAERDDQFCVKQKRMLELLMPHLSEALAHNRLLAASALAPAQEAAAAFGMARRDGAISYLSPPLARVMQQEWPEWKGGRLPGELLSHLAARPNEPYRAKAAIICFQPLGELVLLRARTVAVLHPLSPRETAVASLYISNHSYTDIAKELSIAPATARNFLQRIYAKLEVRSKLELARRLQTHGGERVPAFN